MNVLESTVIRCQARVERSDPLRLGHLSRVYLIWLGGGSCDGCTVAMIGGTKPRLEQLLAGAIPGIPKVELIHSDFSVESGDAWTHNLVMAERGELDAPYILTWEGSVMDESTAGAGHWSGLGHDPETGKQLSSRDWLDRLAPGAAALVAVGTCATWGGIPAARGNPTGASGVGDRLGPGYRSRLELPLINVPGCAPAGDNYLETVVRLLSFANGLGPPPELDDLGRPAWLYRHTIRVGVPDRLVEMGRWGNSAQCDMEDRGAVDGHGGCIKPGGFCIGCTMPGFPDRLDPSVAEPPMAERPVLAGA
ncbi:MAG: NADH-quinone oxidoreductase subunit B family protein [Acidimicrobiales bacterium]